MRSRSDMYKLMLAAVVAACMPISITAAEGETAAAAESPKPDIAKGEEKSQVCIACHGERGISRQDNYPHLHGQRQTYLLRQMRTFRDGGDRRDPIMTPMLENMTDQDLVNLAAYYSSFNAVLGTAARLEQTAGAVMASPEISAQAKERAQEAESTMPAEQQAAVEETAVKPAAQAPVPVAAPASVPAAAAAAGDAAAGQTKSAACAACHGADGRGTTPLFPNLNGQKPDYLVVQLKAFRDGRRTDPTMAPMAAALSDQDITDLAAFYGGLK